jgi:drug/metabolite transporter (DMT)-like permease
MFDHHRIKQSETLYRISILPYNRPMASTPTPQSNLTRGYTIAVASAAVLSTTGIFIRYLTLNYHLPAIILAFWRDVFVGITLLVALGVLRPALLSIQSRHIFYLIGYGLVAAIFNSLWTLSVALNGAALATVLVYCSAAFTALLGWWLLHESLNWVKLLAVAVSLAGTILVSGALDPAAWRSNVLGIMTGVFSGLGYAVYTLMGRSAAQRGLNPWTTLIYTFSWAAAFLLLFNLLLGKILPGAATQPADLLWLGSSLAGWGILILLAAGPTVAGFGMYNVSLSYLPSSVVNLIVMLEPVFTSVIAYFLLGETLNALQLSGGLMILGGVVFLRITEGWRARQEQLQVV